MNGGADPARLLYLELRASGFEVRLEANASGEGVLDYGVVVEGRPSLPYTHEFSLLRRILDNQDELVRFLANSSDPDFLAIQEEFECW